jgi:sarcosine reductase
MRLELNIINIKDIKFGEKTKISGGVLCINRSELQGILHQDKRLNGVDIELAHPGESCRILQVCDVIEPRAKISGGEDFPGALGRQETAGSGKTSVLRGAAIVLNTQAETHLLPEAEDASGNIIDMSGPAAEITPYAKIHNIVLVPHPADRVTHENYTHALKIAGLRTAVYLAEAGKDLKPEEVEIYELPPVIEVAKGIEHLPKVAYIFQVYCTSYPAMASEPILYGDNITRLLPTVLHPKEVFDGAIVNTYHGRGTETYVFQNHPVIKDLYRRHGKDLCFVGVVATVSRYQEPARERSVAMASNIAKSILGANGVIITKSSSGAPDVDASQMAQKCEEQGVKAVLIMFGSESGMESSTVFNLPGANAIVNTGNPFRLLSLPAVKRIIGKPVTLASGLASGELKKAPNFITGALDLAGHTKMVSVQY